MKVINVNNMNNYIFNSKTKYANYKRVPHQKNERNNIFSAQDKNITAKISKNNIFFTEQLNSEESEDWFKTQYSNFNKIKDVNEFSLNEYINKKNDNNKNSNLKQNRNLNKFVRFVNKSQVNINKTNNKIVYTKALPIDSNNEKKIDNLFILILIIYLFIKKIQH